MREASRRIVTALLACSLAVAALPTSALATQDAEMGEEPAVAQMQADKKEGHALPSATVPELGVEVQAAPPAEEPQGHQPLATQAKNLFDILGGFTVQNVVYNRQNPVFPTCVIKDGDRILREGVDYKLSYPVELRLWPRLVMKVEGTGEYSGTYTTWGTAVVDASYFEVEPIPDQTYTGGQIKPIPKVKFGTLELTQRNGDYGAFNVTYKNNVAPGIATATITTDDPDLSGSRDVTFAIKGSPKQFGDVQASHWAKGVVDEATSLGLISGYDDGSFGADDPITRGQVAVVLWKMAGQPATGAREFPDASPREYYYQAVRWAGSKGVVNGYENGNFGPNDRVTREQLAAMLGNYASRVAGREVSGSADDYKAMSDKGSVSPWAVSSVGWCCRSGILTGSGGQLRPQGNASRAEAAKMVVYLRNLAK